MNAQPDFSLKKEITTKIYENVRTDSNDLESMKLNRDQAIKRAQEEMEKRKAAKDREKERKALEEAKNAINGRGDMPASVITNDGLKGMYFSFYILGQKLILNTVDMLDQLLLEIHNHTKHSGSEC